MSLALGCDLTAGVRPPGSPRSSPSGACRSTVARRGCCPRLVGLHKAKELAYFADILSAEEAAAFGLVNRVVADAELDAFVDDWARRLAAGPPLALSMTKKLLNNPRR